MTPGDDFQGLEGGRGGVSNHWKKQAENFQTLEESEPEFPNLGEKERVFSKHWKLYPKHKDSGVEWLGEIPEHWGICPLKYMTRFINGAPFKPSDWEAEGVPIIRIENLNRGEDFNCFAGSMPDKYHVYAGDLLFGWSGNRGTSFGPFLWWREGLHYLNQHIFKLVENRDDKAWLYWCLKAVTHHVEKQAHGIIGMVHITKGDLGAIAAPTASSAEQRAIAAFLDRETARIDALIEKKERLIELLEEKRTALITHAVTKGLNPDAPMKDSGIPSFGAVPSHWQIERNKWFFEERDERSLLGDEELLSVSHITGVTPRSEREVFMFMAESLEGYKVCHPGDLVINTMWAWMGALGIVTCEGIASPSYNVYKPTEQVVPGYVDYLCRTPPYVAEINRFSAGVWSSRLRLYPDAFLGMRTILPPVEEQEAIVRFLETSLARHGGFIVKLRSSVERLREYRLALISAAVTGKIDVRGEAA